jgi:hypothetical protein
MVEPIRCSAVRKDGQPCGGHAQSSSHYCWAHDPALADPRAAKRAEGGRNKATHRRLDKLTPASLRPVLTKLYAALDGLEDGSVEPKVGTAMASVASVIVRVHEAAEMEARVTALEARDGRQPGYYRQQGIDHERH